MVETWEIEWNSSMLEHGRDLGTMEFVIAKGGTTSDVNYVMFDVQDNTWEPLIKAIAERDNSHPDIIRKNIQGLPTAHQAPFAIQGVGGRTVAAHSQDGTFATSPGQARKNFKTAETINNLAQYRKDPTAMNAMRAGLYGRAAGKGLQAAAGKAMDAGRAAKDFATSDAGKAAGRRGLGMGLGAGLGALVAGPLGAAAGGALGGYLAKPGVGGRMKNFMGKVKQFGSDLRHAPAAAGQWWADRRARTEDNDRREALEAGLGRAQTDMNTASARAVPGSQFYDSEMDRASGSINQGLARDYNINIPTDDEGKPTMSAQDAMREEIKQIGERRSEPSEGFFAGMKRRGDERRAKAEAETTGAAYADSNIAPSSDAVKEAPAEEEAPAELAKPPSEAAGEAANADAPPPDEQLPSLAPKDETQLPSLPPTDEQLPSLETGDPQDSVVAPQATATEMDPRMARIRQYLTDKEGREAGQFYGEKTIGPKGSQAELPQRMYDAGFDTEGEGDITDEMIEQMGFTNSRQGRYFKQALMANPRYKAAVAAGDAEQAQQIAEEEVLPSIDMELSEDKHQQDWDYLMKQMNLR